MIIDVDMIPEEGMSLEGEESAAAVGINDAQGVSVTGPVEYRFMAQLVTGELIVTGSLRAVASIKCGRCAESFPATIADPSFDCVREAPTGRESVDLTAEVREAMLLAFPTYPLCNKECKGLCARCGGNLNRNECKCGPPGDLRWGTLGSLDIKGRQHARTKKKNVKEQNQDAQTLAQA
jgi:uncharacterized protein